jgi:hypothetical protein
MLEREACERRVYRLATLLTGNPNAATSVIAQVVDAQPDLRSLDSAHMDRLTVLRSREIAPATLVSEHVPPAISEALGALNPQQREAWVFHHVYRVPPREMARAMDCSVTAMERHLELANESMEKRLGELSSLAPSALLAYSMTVDVPKFYRQERTRRRHTRIAIILLALLGGALLLARLAMMWGRPLGEPSG